MRMPGDEAERARLNARGREILQRKAAGGAVRPKRDQRTDGYVNLLNRYGTSQDSSEAYRFVNEPIVPDMQLTGLYEGNGLFAKIIDAPAEEAIKHGFKLNLQNEDIETFVREALDDLDWERNAMKAIKWARLYGGSIIVMLIDDGCGLEEPVNWENVRSIDELRVFERAVVQPDYTSLYQQDYGGKGPGNRVSKFGCPEFYYVSSIYGSFTVHESRCLVFKNGDLPESTTNAVYRMWGEPEYIRLKRALTETLTTHANGSKLLDRMVQPIYSMKGLSQLLATQDGEDQALRRLQLIDMARGLLSSIAIDADGENYDFKTFQLSGVKDIQDASCVMLSAISRIPQTILYGRSPAGMDATGDSDLENYYSFVTENIQKPEVRPNLRTLLDVIFRAGISSGAIREEPKYNLEFNPLWSMSEEQKANIDKMRADTAFVKAQTAQLYVGMQAIDPSEVRHGLAADETFDVEDLVEEEDDIVEAVIGSQPQAASEVEAVQKNIEQAQAPGGIAQSAAPGTPQALAQGQFAQNANMDGDTNEGVGVLVLKDGKLLTGIRLAEGTLCGPGGHIEDGETPELAAIRETEEEFGIIPNELIPVTYLTGMPKEYCNSHVFLCTEYAGEPKCDGREMTTPRFMSEPEIESLAEADPSSVFLPFIKSVLALVDELRLSEKNPDNPLDNSEPMGRMNDGDSTDGGPGSGNFGHEGVPGQIGGSAPGGAAGDVTRFETVDGKMKITSDLPVKASKSGKTTVTIKAGQEIDGIYSFAGNGSDKNLVVSGLLAKQYGGKPKEWGHLCGFATVTSDDGTQGRKEIHWFEHEQIGQVGFKVKFRGDKE